MHHKRTTIFLVMYAVNCCNVGRAIGGYLSRKPAGALFLDQAMVPHPFSSAHPTPTPAHMDQSSFAGTIMHVPILLTILRTPPGVNAPRPFLETMIARRIGKDRGLTLKLVSFCCRV
jgi:hypothetical protein